MGKLNLDYSHKKIMAQKNCHIILLCTCVYKMNIHKFNIKYPNTFFLIKQQRH
jgi:hypothetical protein